MKAMLSIEPGGPESLTWTELPDPAPAKGELLVEIRAAGVNFPDTLIIQDLYQMKPPRPFAPGGEIAGVVAAIGEGVEGYAIGDRVLALTGHGGFATHRCIDAAQAIRIPDAMPFEDAACFVFTYGTSYHALKDRAHMKPGESLLILGAAGGVGVAAIELGKAMGAKVIAAVSSDDKAAFCREVGADETLVYGRSLDKGQQKDFSSQIKALSGKDGVDVVYDSVGGAYSEPALRAMAWEGRFLVVGFPAGIAQIPMNLPLLKGCDIVGVFWGASVYRDPKGHAENMAELFALYEQGMIKPRISETLKMQDAATALNLVQDRKALGKIVLTND
ncbi:MAG: NADPH:quinone oxidoreductase family protein [Pseudophaeobacter sp. bin_em_oilr2.035]|uniref:NADPH:quinone oxidoreductase family protein n=1 Tax=Phaeobacter gallaeciensis TaxID=60890 RepID=A0ABD4X6B9_9RHOB|nr:NADPH:quinone oxidoreductase family protein [Phaeobacter gallaeciensis]MDF1771438.1 NADPH:quinone oxidoreductase family protein [Pseudophaeobacter sp. bin_em_oilr2.035]MDE4143632.1 NADPH:quinone oxidoreductase family protein [Phaeobacter gallaeciensis]MDE4156006.1 NADPH:quinone oxidoreductase family protein [Phaeobacter gallaeciensis]MDE4160194.1 NADPH:quinone oxidoreductase family protein [Phaeobacter gallaeciensis]MDE4164712.1 NADPH:quinone oxidoreductase family protein [Phaeobacter galla